MERTLISFLGATCYSETVYCWGERGEHRTASVAAALARLWEAGRVIVLATEAAEAANGGQLREALEMERRPRLEIRRLPDGRDDRELWMQFQTMRQAVADASDGEVLLDITHGFRAQSFFAGAILSVLRSAGVRPKALTVVYGEYRSDAPSPIWDLTLFADLIDWAQALSVFLRTGVAEPLVELSTVMHRRAAGRAARSQTGEFPRFHRLTKAVERFASDIATVRIASIITGTEGKKSSNRGSGGSAARLLAAIEECREDVAAQAAPLSLILDALARDVAPLVAERLFTEKGRKAQEAMMGYYVKRSRYPEAAIVAREMQVSCYAEDERGVEVNSGSFESEQRKRAEEQFVRLDRYAREIAEIRNDIGHGGFRERPLPAKTLRERVRRLAECLPRLSADPL